MATGFDVYAAEAVLEKKKIYDIFLVCALPYPDFCQRQSDGELCSVILKNADMVKTVCEHYHPGVFQVRNQWMADRSSRIIAAYNGTAGGTRNAINYARKKNIQIINILEPVTSWIDESFFE